MWNKVWPAEAEACLHASGRHLQDFLQQLGAFGGSHPEQALQQGFCGFRSCDSGSGMGSQRVVYVLSSLAHYFLDICEEAGLNLRHQLRAILVDGAKGTIAGIQQAGSLIVIADKWIH